MWKSVDILHSVRCDVVDRAAISGRDRVVVAPAAWRGELSQNILGLMEGHQTHTKQGEAETQNRYEQI